MKFTDFLAENMKRRRVLIQEGPYKGNKGMAVFSKVKDDDLRYYVVELDTSIKGVDVVIVFNGEFDWA